MPSAKPRKPRPGSIALAGLPALERAAVELSRAQFGRCADALHAICQGGSNVSVVALEQVIALAARTPRDDPPPVDCSHEYVCDWCGATHEPDDSPVAWPDVMPVRGFCDQTCWEAHEEHEEATHQAAVDRAREPDRWRPLRRAGDF
jgi:hypothetical protein